MSSKHYIWLSKRISSGSPIDAILREERLPEAIKSLSVEERERQNAFINRMARDVKTGVPITQEDVGDIWLLNASKRVDLGGFTNGGGWPMVSESQKNLLEQFDIGQTLFHPLRILDVSKTFPTTIEPYYLLNVCNHKDTPELEAIFDVEKPSRAALRDLSNDFGKPFYMYRFLEKDTFKGRAATLRGPDIWIDPLIHESMFLSDRLVKAITMAGFANGWKLVRCAVVGAA